MVDDRAIIVDHVTKAFRLPHEKHSSLKSALIGRFKGAERSFERQVVLDDLSIEIKKGEFFGIVGRNGSGKSTLLKLLAGVYSPDSGAIHINGKLTPFIELGVGFNPELTGRENVYLNGALLGFGRKQIDEMYNEVVSFAELHKFMDQKLKNYSSGMQVRLAFSIAIRARSDILLLDEVLAVGDALFQKKCYNYFKQLKREKRTVVFVSHDTGALQEYCDRGALIENGKLVQIAKIEYIVRNYLDMLNGVEAQRPEQQVDDKKRWGTGKGEVLAARITSRKSAHKEKDDIKIEVDFSSKQTIDEPVYGITVTDGAGDIVFQSNTLWRKTQTGTLKVGLPATVEWTIPNVFNTGTYFVAPALADSTGTETYDWVEEAASFDVAKQQKSHGYMNVEHGIKINQSKTD